MSYNSTRGSFFGQDKIRFGQFFYLGKNLLPSAHA